MTDEAGNPRRYTYNILGQMTKVEEYAPDYVSILTTTYKYYGFGPLYESNQSGQIRTFVYNWLGQQLSQTLPESGGTTYQYDAAGRLTSKIDARGVTTTLSYDNANRLTQRSYSAGTPTVTFGYDANGYTGLKTLMTLNPAVDQRISAVGSFVIVSFNCSAAHHSGDRHAVCKRLRTAFGADPRF